MVIVLQGTSERCDSRRVSATATVNPTGRLDKTVKEVKPADADRLFRNFSFPVSIRYHEFQRSRRAKDVTTTVSPGRTLLGNQYNRTIRSSFLSAAIHLTDDSFGIERNVKVNCSDTLVM